MYRPAKRFGLLFVAVALPGCNQILDLFQPPDGPVETGSSVLKAFESESEVSAYFKRHGREGAAPLDSADGAATGDSAPEAPPSPALADDDFSGTTIQEVGVD